jgi:hypothetical protein
VAGITQAIAELAAGKHTIALLFVPPGLLALFQQ